MAWLAVSWADGRSDSIELTHRKPVAIGAHAGSNVVVDDEGIAALACRIAWNGSDYEVVAATDDDVLLNGKRVRRRRLEHRDEVAIGSAKITLHRGHAPKAIDGDRDSATEPQNPPPVRANPEIEEEEVDSADPVDEFEELENDQVDVVSPLSAKAVVPKPTSAKSRIRERLHARARRPGEQDAIRSPLVYGLAGGVVVLVVATLALTIFLRGQSIAQQFQSAMAAQSAGRYSDAEREFERFIKRHPGHSLTAKAKRELALTQVDRLIRGEVPQWQDGYVLLNDLIGAFRDDEDFGVVHGAIAERAGLIALGAAVDAGRERKLELVQLSERAEAMLGQYSPDAVAPETLIQKVVSVRTASRNRLVQLDVLDDFLSRMDAAAKEEHSLDVLEIAGQLAAVDNELTREPPVRKFVESATTRLRDQVLVTRFDSAGSDSAKSSDTAASQALASPWATTTIAIVDRPAGEALPDGRPLFVWHDDTYFACDKSAGDPLWIRPLPDSFRPVPISVPQSGAIAFDRDRNSIVLLDNDKGEAVRSVVLPDSDQLPKRPCVEGSVAFVPIGTELLRMEIDTEHVTASIEIGQTVLAEPALVQTPFGKVLLVVGESQLLYVLDPRSLKLLDMHRLGHPPGSILAPPAVAAEFVLLAVNQHGADTCDIHMLTTEEGATADDLAVRQVDRAQVSGLVVDPPVLRGRDLFVASTPERVTVLTVSDEQNGRLTRGDPFTAGRANDTPVPTYLLAGPDREFWMAGRRLLRLRATAETIRVIGDPIPLNVPVQPPIVSGSDIYVTARRGRGTTATLSRVDGVEYRERWQVQLASNVVGLIQAPGASKLYAVTELGDIAAVNLSATEDRGQTQIVSSQVDDVGGRVDSACEFGDRLAVASADKVALVGATGRVVKRMNLKTRTTASVVAWGERLVVPTAGKLKLYDRDGRAAMADFWLAQDGKTSVPWRSVHPVDDSHLLAIDTNNTLRILTAVEGDAPHLAETSTLTVDELQDVALLDETLFVATSTAIAAYNPLSLAETPLPFETELGLDTIVSLESLGENLVIVGTIRGSAVIVRASDGKRVSVDSRPNGRLITANGTHFVTTSDRVLQIDAESFDVVASDQLPTRSAAYGRFVHGRFVVPLEDGSLAIRQSD